MPSSRARTSASRETCFSALSWRSAPTKSRLMVCLLLCCSMKCGVPPTQRNVGWSPTFPGGPAMLRRLYTGPRGAQPATAGRASAAGEHEVAGKPPVDVLLEQVDELRDDVVAAQGAVELPVHEHRRDRRLERARKADPDVGVLRLAGTVHDAAHDGDLHVLDARVR